MRVCTSSTYILAYILDFVKRRPGVCNTVKAGSLITRDLLCCTLSTWIHIGFERTLWGR